MTYQYMPSPKKQIEKLICVGLIFLSCFSFALSNASFVLFPLLLRCLSIVCLIVSVFLASGCLLRKYCYFVEEGSTADGADFIVTELYGKRRTVVCRIAVSDILSIEAITAENKKRILQKTRHTTRYDYTAILFSKEVYLLTVLQNQEQIFIKILADQSLLKLISSS